MLITAAQPRRKSLVALYIDNEFYADIDKETFMKSSWHIGDRIDEEEIEELLFECLCSRAKNRGMYLLGFRDYSSKDMFYKLKTEFDEDSARAAVDFLNEKGYINDDSYARRLAADLVKRKKLSGYRLVSELRMKGIEQGLAEDAAAEASEDIDKIEIIKATLEKKYPYYTEDEKQKRRAYNALVRMGYSYGDINKAMSLHGESE